MLGFCSLAAPSPCPAQQGNALCRQLRGPWPLCLAVPKHRHQPRQAGVSAGHWGRQLQQISDEVFLSLAFKDLGTICKYQSSCSCKSTTKMTKPPNSTFFLFNLCTSKQAKWDCRFLASWGKWLLCSPSLPLTPLNLLRSSPTHHSPAEIEKESKGTQRPCKWAVHHPLAAQAAAGWSLQHSTRVALNFGVFVPGSQQGVLLFSRQMLTAVEKPTPSHSLSKHELSSWEPRRTDPLVTGEPWPSAHVWLCGCAPAEGTYLLLSLVDHFSHVWLSHYLATAPAVVFPANDCEGSLARSAVAADFIWNPVRRICHKHSKQREHKSKGNKNKHAITRSSGE